LPRIPSEGRIRAVAKIAIELMRLSETGCYLNCKVPPLIGIEKSPILEILKAARLCPCLARPGMRRLSPRGSDAKWV
jgi:hypothetical protein